MKQGSMQEALEWQRHVLGYGKALMRLGRLMELGEWGDMQIKEIRVRAPQSPGDQFLVVVKGSHEGGRFVAFHNAETVEDAVKGAVSRLENQTLKWREDRPYGGGGGPAGG